MEGVRIFGKDGGGEGLILGFFVGFRWREVRIGWSRKMFFFVVFFLVFEFRVGLELGRVFLW